MFLPGDYCKAGARAGWHMNRQAQGPSNPLRHQEDKMSACPARKDSRLQHSLQLFRSPAGVFLTAPVGFHF